MTVICYSRRMKMTTKIRPTSPELWEKIIADLQSKLDKQAQEISLSKAELASFRKKYFTTGFV
jgi:hypothetical protein